MSFYLFSQMRLLFIAELVKHRNLSVHLKVYEESIKIRISTDLANLVSINLRSFEKEALQEYFQPVKKP